MSSEGWCNDDYLILFSEEESIAKCQQYKLTDYLPGYRVIGLKGWDDFIVMNDAGHLFTVPAVPLIQKYIEPFGMPSPLALDPDERFQGRIKWYIKPIVFGGDPSAGENITWLSHEQHAQVVTWWNEQYLALTSGGENA